MRVTLIRPHWCPYRKSRFGPNRDAKLVPAQRGTVRGQRRPGPEASGEARLLAHGDGPLASRTPKMPVPLRPGCGPFLLWPRTVTHRLRTPCGFITSSASRESLWRIWREPVASSRPCSGPAGRGAADHAGPDRNRESRPAHLCYAASEWNLLNYQRKYACLIRALITVLPVTTPMRSGGSEFPSLSNLT